MKFENPALREKIRFTEKDAKKSLKNNMDCYVFFTFSCNTLESKKDHFTKKDAKTCALPRRFVVTVFVAARHF